MGGPTARALALLSLLQTRRHWKGPELAQRLGVSERTVRRDVDRLRELGYPVDAGPGIDGGYRLGGGTELPPLLLDDNEAVSLVVGLRTAAVSGIEGTEETTVALMAKLDQILPDRVRRRVEALRDSVDVLSWSTAGTTVPVEALTVLSQGCRDREEVRFDYVRRDGEESRRLVQPYQLVSAGRRWYLVAWDVRRDDWRTFRVDRLMNPALAGGRFEPRDLPAEDAAAFVAQGMRTMTVEHRATVIVAASVAEVEAAGHWFGATAEAIDEGRTRMSLGAENRQWLVSMIAMLAVSFDVEIVEADPEVRALLDRVARRLRRIRAR